MDKLNLSAGGLGNYLSTLNKKGLIFKNDFDAYEIKKHLMPENHLQKYYHRRLLQ